MSYEDKKKRLLKESQELDKAIESVINSDQNKLVIKPHHREKIEDLQQQSKSILDKLKKDEFEIAVVGLEKAGKSTLVNALIHKDILPSASKRCTFTSTKLIKSDQDSAVIELYTKDEFEKKVFQKLLKDVEFPEWEKQSLDNFYLQSSAVKKKITKPEDFLKWFSKLETQKPELFKLHSGKTDEEIIDILKYQDSLELTGKTHYFTKEEIESEEFREYIKGVDLGESNEDTDTGKPRSVKNVEIKSTQLQNFKEPILYDVPGFDSPTEIHEQETITRLQNSDVIVLVTNVGDKPNINSPQLKILKDETDKDGIPLKDKLFVFGNKFDTANSKDIAKQNQKTLENDVSNKHKIAKVEKVFIGSALKYLVDNDLKRDDETHNSKYEIENNGVSELKDSLISYQQKEIFDVRENRIKHLQSEIKAVFEDILNSDKLQNIDPDMDEDDLIEAIKDKTKAKIRKDTVKALNDIRDSLDKKFLKETPFAQKLTDEVSNFFKPVTEEEIEYFATDKKEVSLTNHTFRQNKFEELLKDFTAIVSKSVEHQTAEVEKDIFDSFVKSIQDSPEIQNILKPKFSENYTSQEGKFDYLLERFGRRVLNSIIRYPVGDSDRKRAFTEHQEEFKFLDSRSELENGTVINMIATGTAKALQGENSIKVFKDSFFKALQKLPNSPKNYALECENSLLPQLEKLESESNSFNIDELFKSSNTSSISEIVDEINNDIKNFKTILEKAVIPTLDLEIIFMGRVDAEIRKLRETIESGKMDGAIRKAVKVVAKDRLANVEKEIEINKAKLQIKTEIESFLNAN